MDHETLTCDACGHVGPEDDFSDEENDPQGLFDVCPECGASNWRE